MQTAGFPAVSGARSLLCILAVVGWPAPREAGAATITISGQVNDAQGLPLRGVSVRLYRNGPPDLDTTTDVNGRFSWTTAPGRYRVEPKLFKCTFLPNERGLPNVPAA